MTIYVRTDGSDSNNGLTDSSGGAKLTLQGALSKSGLAGGDTIIMRSGTFTGSATTAVAGSAGNPITIQGAGTSTTIQTGKLTLNKSYYSVSGITWRGGGVEVNNATNVILDGIESYRTLKPVYILGAGAVNCELKNSLIHHGGWNSMCDIQGTSNLVSGNTFSNNNGYDVHHCNGAISCIWRGNTYNNISTPINTTTTSTDSFTIGTGQKTVNLAANIAWPTDYYVELYVTGSSTNFMRGWVVSVVGTVLTIDVVVTGGSGTYSTWTVRSDANGNHADCFQAFGNSGPAHDCVVEGNLFYSCSGQLGNFEADTVVPVRVYNWTFRNNIHRESRIQMNAKEGTYGFKFHNNTIFSTSGTAGFGSSDVVECYNNAFCRVGNIASAGPYNIGASLTKDYNFMSMYATDGVKSDYVYNGTTQLNEQHGINGGYTPSQLFVDATNGDFHLASGSPLIGAGTDLSSTGFATDYAGTARTGAWSIGAYAYTVSGSPTCSAAAIPSAGTTVVITWSASCTNGAGGGNGLTLNVSGTPLTLTYVSGSGSNTYTYSIPSTVRSTDLVVSLSYTQPGNGVEATSGGVDVGTFTDFTVTNNSTQVAVATITNRIKRRLGPSRGSFL